jgi:hypothetical protein
VAAAAAAAAASAAIITALSLQWLGAGGLTAFLQKDPATGSPIPDVLLWDLSDPAHPKYSHGLYTPGGACTDE